MCVQVFCASIPFHRNEKYSDQINDKATGHNMVIVAFVSFFSSHFWLTEFRLIIVEIVLRKNNNNYNIQVIFAETDILNTKLILNILCIPRLIRLIRLARLARLTRLAHLNHSANN